MDPLLQELEIAMEELRQLGCLVVEFTPEQQENLFMRM